MTAKYPYRPIIGPSIRLIQILEEDPADNVIRCKMIHMPLNVSPPPEYIALSYTWGDSQYHRTIVIDNHRVAIPENLWHAFYYIRLYEALDASRGYGPWGHEQTIFVLRRPWLVWADAVCINQADANEKSREIPRMMEIFSSAKEILGWLGHRLPLGVSEERINYVLEKAKDISRLNTIDEKRWINLWLGRESELRATLEMDGGDMESIMETVFRIAELPWFSRLWIIQEYAVSQSSAVLALGGHLFDACDFHAMLVLFAHRHVWYLKPTALECPIAMARIRDRHMLHTGNRSPVELTAIPETDHELDAFAQRLQGLLAKASLAPFESTIKHDMIYGILSMAMPPTPMPPELAVDYTLPWPEVCRRYAKFMAERTGAISFLTRIRALETTWSNLENKDEIPSWVPDFSSMSISSNPGPWHLIEKARYKGSKVSFSEDGLAMTLDGFVLGKPVALTRRRDLALQQEKHYTMGKESPFNRDDAQEFVEAILKPAAYYQSRPLDDILESWICAWESALDRAHANSEVSTIRQTFKRWLIGKGPEKLDLEASKIGGRVFSERGRNVWRRLKNKSRLKNWIVTSDGRGWMALFLSEVKPDDIVVALRGLEEHPAVLRETEQEGRFRLVGLLIERAPASGAWENNFKDVIEEQDSPWARTTIV